MPRPRRQLPQVTTTTGEAACWVAVRDGCARPDDWFPESVRDMDMWNRRAMKICTDCPIREECLQWALRRMAEGPMDSIPGIWGGTTYNQRVLLLRRRYGL